MRALSFLGPSNYEKVTYHYDGQLCTTQYFPIAVCEFFHPNELIVFMTEAASRIHQEALSAEITSRGYKMRPVNIPEGKREEEIWQLFDTLTENLDTGDEVVVDITHGFRSLVVLATFAAIYLKVAKSIRIHRMVYGAYEARGDNGLAPVFDLSPFLTLMDWTTATDQFLKTGNSNGIASLLEETQSKLWRGSVGSMPKNMPTHLQRVARAIKRTSSAIHTVRVHEALAAAANLTKRLKEAEEQIYLWSKPFSILFEQTRQTYERLALENPQSDDKSNLRAQLRLIRWYIDRDEPVAAIILAREWVISLLTYRLGWNLLVDRRTTEALLGEYSARTSDAPRVPAPLKSIENVGAILSVWNTVYDLRNDIAHAGMRESPAPLNSVRQRVSKLYELLSDIAPDLVPGSDDHH